MVKLKNDKTTMESRVIAIFGSINFSESTHSDLPQILKSFVDKVESCLFVENYYVIAHDDTNTPHIHYILELSTQKRLKTLLNDFEKLGYNRNAVNIGKLGVLCESLRYMLHMTEESINDGKKKYLIDNLVSNMPIEYIENCLASEDDNFNVDRLIAICLECDGNKVSIMRKLGLSIYHKYRFEINDILNYEMTLRFARDKERDRREKEKLNELPF